MKKKKKILRIFDELGRYDENSYSPKKKIFLHYFFDFLLNYRFFCENYSFFLEKPFFTFFVVVAKSQNLKESWMKRKESNYHGEIKIIDLLNRNIYDTCFFKMSLKLQIMRIHLKGI